MSRYRFTCLTPVLAGDGGRLAPIDYMVWKDQINILDQKRIFKLLSRGPRLDSYLAQIRRAEKLDFASWGGYAQNFALRRIPLDEPGLISYFDRAHPDDLFIPTFATTPRAALYLPASVLKGALRTGMAVSRTDLKQVQANVNHAATRSAARYLEQATVGEGGNSRTRRLSVADSAESPAALTRVYLTADLHAALPRQGTRTRLEMRLARIGGSQARGRFHAHLRRDGPAWNGLQRNLVGARRNSPIPTFSMRCVGKKRPAPRSSPRRPTTPPKGSSPTSGPTPKRLV